MLVLKGIWFILKIMAHNLCVILTFEKSKKKWLSITEAVVREMEWDYTQETDYSTPTTQTIKNKRKRKELAKRQKILTPEFWKKHKKVMKYLKSGMMEQDLGIVYNQPREVSLKHLEEMVTRNKTK